MTGQQAIAFGIVGTTLVMLVWARWRYDVVAVFALLAVVIGGLVPARDAFAGFAHPAVITVAAVLIVSRGLQNAGLVDVVVKAIGMLRGRPGLQIAAQCLVIACLSGFMNNVGALALMLPVALRNAYRDGYSPGQIAHAACVCVAPRRSNHAHRYTTEHHYLRFPRPGIGTSVRNV